MHDEILVLIAKKCVMDAPNHVDYSTVDKVTRHILDFSKKLISKSEFILRLKELLNNDSVSTNIIDILNTPSSPLNSSNNVNRKIIKKNINYWREKEDRRLMFALYKFGTNDWDSVAKFVGNSRTRAQCRQRWNRVISPNINKGSWTEDELCKLLNLVKANGTKSWKRISELMGDRSDVQCRYQYSQMLKNKSFMEKVENTEMSKDDNNLFKNLIDNISENQSALGSFMFDLQDMVYFS